jgi:hypothetical protein
MNYLNIYNLIILKAQKRIKNNDDYYEKHHILPKCIGGNNLKENLVYLTAKEHFICHHLLFKIYGGSKLANAWYAMCRIGKGQEKRNINSRLFKNAKETRSRILSDQSIGNKNHFYGKTHSAETKLKISLANKNRKKSEEEVYNWVKKVASKSKSKEHRSKIGRYGLTMIQNIHTKEIKRVPLDLIGGIYDTNEWVNPRKITPEQKHKCLYCEVITTKSNLKRWHNENCKNYTCR